MAKASTHIAPGNDGYFAHNTRESFSLSQVFFDEKNEIGSTKEEAFKTYHSELAARSTAYKERVGQKIQKKTVTHLSAIVNLEQHHTLKDLKPLADFIEKELNTKITQTAIHRDEGKLVNKETGEILTSGEQFFCNPEDKKLYFDESYEEPINMNNWEKEKNYHAHIEFMGLASDGKSIKRELTTYFFRKLQDKTAEVLGMERGQITQPSYTKEQMIEIKKELKPKKTYANDKAYGTAFTAKAKELGYWQPKPKHTKRKDTHPFKEAQAKANELNAKALANQKDLKEKIDTLKIQLQAQSAERQNYAESEELNKVLKERIRAKDLTIEELQTKMEKYQEKNEALKNKIAALPSLDTLEKLKTLKNDFEELSTEYGELEELAYENDYETIFDEYGIAFDKTFTFKERYQNSLEKIETLKDELKSSNIYTNKLDNDFEKIEKIAFGEVKNRDVEEIIEEVGYMRDIIRNISKYFEIRVESLVGLFKKGVASNREIEDVQPKKKIESILLPDKKSISKNNPTP